MWATIVKDRFGNVHTRFTDDEADAGGDVEVIDILQSREGEPDEEFTERCEKFVQNLK